MTIGATTVTTDEFAAGQVLEIVSKNRENAFDRLSDGQTVTHLGIDEALKATGSDDFVYPVTLYDHDNPPEGQEWEDVEGIQAIKSSKYGRMGYAGPDYTIVQRGEIVETAYDIVGLARDEARITHMVNIGNKAEKFLTHISVPEIVIDPEGFGDVIHRGLWVATSYDSSLPTTIGYSNERLWCKNQLPMLLKGLAQTIKIKHTKNAQERLEVAARALGYVGAIEKQVVKNAERMLKVDGDTALTTLLDHFWKVEDDMSDRAKTRRMRERGDVRMLYEGEDNTNVAKVGRNGWAAYNAVVEYLDFAQSVRGVKGDEALKRRAENSFLPGRTVDRKIRASAMVMGLAA